MTLNSGNAGRKLSRRSFLGGSMVTTAGMTVIDASSALIGKAEADEGGLSLVGPAPVNISMKVNGLTKTLQVNPQTTLAEALRDSLGLTGTKVACDRGACSSCTVWLDGMTICSCMMLAIEVGERSVTTIEGLATNGELHPVQAAFIEHDAMQCGFCTSGMVMSCAALLERVPAPTVEDIKNAISGHLCRCGTYPHIIAAMLAAAQMRKT